MERARARTEVTAPGSAWVPRVHALARGAKNVLPNDCRGSTAVRNAREPEGLLVEVAQR